ncbi:MULTISPECIES: FAD-dependent oxidoreductase [Helicobacter]|uniref:malate dehydrogenase (quinone) n=1 Tax=Helicobacter ibis TaxID=2962633 RepID=A0ABT4VF69_9HELI|nr:MULTISPECIES: FAD-dependent oxidoreductase [Helicobacter]MDA3966615.1 FAD-dependent oxidoreductase [Helicobacter sp. WB40]MDA3968770.1 FAD-dependent oxidoreductase [Helicobacter ibis]
MNNSYDVAIIGGGISGSALFYTLTHYTDIKKVVLLEKYDRPATLSSSANNNSQTIHAGDIETNYTKEKAKKVRRAAKLIENYALFHNLQNKSIFECQKMAFGVGDKEVEFIKSRHNEFSEIYPELELFNKDTLREIEPNIIKTENGSNRSDNVVGSGIKKSFCAMNFCVTANHMIETSIFNEHKAIFNFKVKNIVEQGDGGYTLQADGHSPISAKFVLVNAGAHSLFLAHNMGYGLELGCLPVSGSFYFIPGNKLNGKVYTVQNPKLPFAAIHGDPDIVAKDKTRLGPTALALPKLERFKSGTFLDFLKISGIASGTLNIMFDLLSDSEIRSYIFRNFLYEIPSIGKKYFLQEAKKIIPSIRLEDLSYASGFGGIRPQVLDKKEKKLILGEKKIKSNKGITFNMTPSPGATSCLKNALVDMMEITEYLGAKINMEKVNKELKEDSLEWLID